MCLYGHANKARCCCWEIFNVAAKPKVMEKVERSWKKWKGHGKSGKAMEKVERSWKKWKGHGKSGKVMEEVERSWKKWKGHGKSHGKSWTWRAQKSTNPVFCSCPNFLDKLAWKRLLCRLQHYLTTALHVQHTFLYILSSPLHHDVKMFIFTFYGGHN